MKKIICLLLLSVFLVSCGTRKVNKSKVDELTKVDSSTFTKKEVKIVDTTKVETKTKLNEDLVEVDNDLILEPINKDKPIDVVDASGQKRSYYNAKVTAKSRNKKLTKELNVEQKTSNNISKEINKLENKKVSSESNKTSLNKDLKVNNTMFGFWFWFWIILLLIAAYLVYKFKEKIF